MAKALAERRSNLNVGLTRPEIAMLLARSKIALYNDIVDSVLPDEAFFVHYLAKAFPRLLSKRYGSEMQSHYLRRELIATQISNALINDMGIIFVPQMRDELGACVSDIVRAYVVSREIFNMDEIWASIRALEIKLQRTSS